MKSELLHGHMACVVYVSLPIPRLKEVIKEIIIIICERFEPKSQFKSIRLSLIVRVNVVLNRTVVVDSD